MEITLETINILFFLIPGLLSSLIFDTIVVRKELSNTSRIIEALLFNFILYIILNFISEIELFAALKLEDGKYTYEFSKNISFIIYLLSLSVVIPIVLGAIVYYDIYMWLLRKFRITDKTSRDSTWLDVFIECKNFIVIHFKDGRRIMGWPAYYSDIPEKGFIYLYNPQWINEENKYIKCGTQGILIKTDDIYLVEFLIDQLENNIKK